MFDVFYFDKKPGLFVHEQQVDSIQQAQQQSRTRYFWIVDYLLDYSSFDFLYEPRPWQSQYTQVWASQYHKFSGTYLVPKHGDVENYHFVNQVIPLKVNSEHFEVVYQADFDFAWKPHPHDEPYIYVFGNQHYPAEKFPTVQYHAPGATQYKYMEYPKAQLRETSDNWQSLVDAAYTFDHSWAPDPGDPPMTYVFGNQWHSAVKMPTVQYRARDVDPTSAVKYMSYPRATLLPVLDCWTIPDSIDSAQIDFSWCPDPGSPPYIYQFATQHQKTGGPVYTVPGATEIKYLDEIKVRTERTASAIYEIDHMDGNTGHIANTTKIVRYFDNYLDTLKRIAKNAPVDQEWVWVCSSVCDYTGFDFSWHPEQWQATMLHVFPSDDQKFGDTFFMHVPTFANRADKCQLLEWYDLNFVSDKSVPRRPMPVIHHNQDSQVDAVKTREWSGPLALFTRTDSVDRALATVPLWRESTKTIVPLDPGASSVIVPRVAVPYIKTQLYDYPYIDREHMKLTGEPLDIVFLSNGEKDAEFLHEHLVYCAFSQRISTVKHVKNVKGRVASQHAAAHAATTDWYFVVPGKLQVDRMFDWSWQPDRMQQAKHYIFHAHNPVNGLVYGHMAMVAYNKKLVLETQGTGLDFTMEKAHEVVPIVSGTAMYAETPMMAWRTAFREVLKLQVSLPDVENEYRLSQWLTKDISADQWSMKGAQDAVEFYNEVNGDPTELHKSYEWSWLASYAFIKRGLT
jgi:hypothetical protein